MKFFLALFLRGVVTFAVVGSESYTGQFVRYLLIQTCVGERMFACAGRFTCNSLPDDFNQALREYKHVLANISRSRYVAIATQPVHRLQIRPIVHN